MPQLYPVHWIGLRWTRQQLWERIENRVDSMLSEGWVDEVKSLAERGYDAELKSLGALGYRFILSYLNGELSYDDMREKTVVATRRYAKRQMTWFKANSQLSWFDGPVDLADLEAYVSGVWGEG